MADRPTGNSRDAARLGAADWIEAAFDMLAAQGVDRVSIVPLAKKLGVTKGSFYWHYKDRDELLMALLSQWRRRATLQIIDRIESADESPAARLHRLLRLPFRSSSKSMRGADIELSIRLWGRTDPRAREALAEVDQLRLSYIRQLLMAAGVPAHVIAVRAVEAYSFMRVATTLVPAGDLELVAQLGDELLSRK